MTAQNTIERTYTISETAHVLALPVRVVAQLIDDGEISTVPTLSGPLVTAGSIDEFVRRLVDEARAGRSGSLGAGTKRGPVGASTGFNVRQEPQNPAEGDDGDGTHAKERGGRKVSPARRANGEGAPYKRSDGRWEIKFFVEDPITGQRKRRSVYAKRRADAIKAMKDQLSRAAVGAPLRDSTATVGSWARQWMTTTLPVLPISENYRDQQRSLTQAHFFEGTLAETPLNLLRPTGIEAWLVDLQSRTRVAVVNGHPVVKRVYSESTVRSLFLLLRKMLDAAVRDGLIARNPAAHVAAPRVSRQAVVKLSAADVTRLIRALRNSRLFPAYAFIATTGVRRGEALALRWDDVDLDSRVAWVRTTLSSAKGGPRESTTKTDGSRRQVVFPPAIAEMLRDWRRQQAAEQLRAGPMWEHSGRVFSTSKGGEVDPRDFLRTLQSKAKTLGLPAGVGVHTLRHSAATAMLEAGVHVKAVSDSLGHSSSQVTLDIYGFTADRVARAAAEGLAAAFGITADDDGEGPEGPALPSTGRRRG